MADDPWAEAGAQPGGAGGYLSDADFRAAMDATFGKGRWRETGGYRSQAREAALRAAGAQTVPAGHTSPHSLGEADAPGAHDIAVDGLTPAQAAAAVRARASDLFTPLPEDAHGGQGAHLHLSTARGTAGGDPWGEGTADPWSEAKPAHRSFLEEAGRMGSSLIGGAVTGAGKLLKAAGEFGDVYAQAQADAAAHGVELSPTGQPILTPEAAKPEFGKIATEHQPVVSSITDPWAEATEAAGEKIAPTNRQGVESVLHGAGEFVAPLAAMTVDPALGGVVFGVQGYGQAHDEAVAKGAPEGEAQDAGVANFGVQAALGMVPVGELTAPLSASLKGLAKVGARLGANVVGDAALGAAMQTGSNLVARQTYDPDRPWYDQVPQSAAMMAAGGLVVHGTHEALGGAKALLRRPEALPAAAPDAEVMPETNAIRAYAGKGPVEPEAPAPPEEEAGARPVVPGESGARNPAASPIATGDYVLFDAGRNPVHGQVIGDEMVAGQGGEPTRMLLVKTPAGNAVVPASQAVALPGDFEGARIAAGAPLEQMPQAIADVAELRRAAPKGYSVLQAIRDLGGIRTKGADGSPTEVSDLVSGQRLQPGVVNNKTGMTPDAMREALQQRGWFGETAPDANRPAGEARGDAMQDLLDIVDKGMRQRVVHPSEVDGDVRRKDLEGQMNSAGVGIMTEPLPQAAAKLAAWRGEHVKAQGQDMALLRKRAEDLGVRTRSDASYDELLADVVEREAIQGEATAADADEYEGMIDAELTPEEHEWLAAGPRGAESEPGPSFEPEGAPGRDEELPAQEGGGQHGEGPGGGGEDQGPAGEEPVESLRAASDKMERALARARQVAIDKYGIKKNKTDPSKWPPEALDLFQRQYAENVRAEAKGNVPENIAANDFRKAEMERAAKSRAAQVGPARELDVGQMAAAGETTPAVARAQAEVDALNTRYEAALASGAGNGQEAAGAYEYQRIGSELAYAKGELMRERDQAERDKAHPAVAAARAELEAARAALRATQGSEGYAERSARVSDAAGALHQAEIDAGMRTANEVLQMPGPKSGILSRNAIHVSRFPDGLWRAGAEYSVRNAGGGGAAHINDKGFATRQEAIDHAADDMRRNAWRDIEGPGSGSDVAGWKKIVAWLDKTFPATPLHLAEVRAAALEDMARYYERLDEEKAEPVYRKLAENLRAKGQEGIDAAQKAMPKTAPTVERQDIGGETVQQQLLAGGERSARQAAKAREGALKARVPQRDAGDLFGAPEPEAGDLFGKDPWADKGETPPEPPRDIAATPEAREARAEAGAPKGSGYGEKNKLFNKEAADQARAKLAELHRRSSSGIDPEMIHAGITLAGYHVEAGARKFGDYAAAMLSDLGEWAAPYLRMWYNALRDYPEFDAEGMTPHDKITDAAVEEARANVRRSSPDLEPDREGTAPADADGAQPLSPRSGEAERGPGSEGTGAAAAGLRPEGGERLPDGRAPPVGEGGAGELFQGPSGAGGRVEGGGEPGGSDVARDAGVQPDRIPATDLERVADEAAHLDPVSAEAHPDAEAANAPPVPRDIEEALPTLFPEQRADVAFAEQRFEAPDGHGVMFTNGTGTGKTFTGGGIVKRFVDRGRKDVLVLAPTPGILNAWREALKQLGVDFHVLESTEDGGKGVTGTTYANLAANRALARRKWDLVVPDESHTLSSDMEGSETQALAHFRAITNHPDRLRLKAEMLMPKDVDRVKALRDAIPKGQISGPAWDKWLEAQHALDDKLRAKVVDLAQEPRAKAAFLSATPFAYDKSVDYAQGYLFDYPPPTGRGYNDPADGRDDFMIRHFGYRMRTGKLTKPEAGVESDVMERQFHEWLRRKGALSGRVLTVDKDYDRKFALIDGGVGRKIDEALTFLREADDGKFRDLAGAVEKRFDYLSRARLLEAIKAKGVIPRIRAHLALGRKVVVFHNYNEGGGFNPFDGIENVSIVKDGRPVSVAPLVAEFHDRNPGIRELGQEIAALGSPLEQLTKAFPEALIYNGSVPKARRAQAMQAFNRDGSNHNLIIVQSEAGQAGISLHDTTGKHQRAIENLGLPGRPVAAIQQEGRIYRIGQASDAIFRYLNTGTNWERHAFATTIAQRAGTAENLALGEQARTMRDSFINAFLDSGDFPPARGEGRGGKAADRDLAKSLTDFQKAKSFYFSEGKKTGRRDSREGKDYFATPEPVGLKMVEWADVRPGDKVLEPSAGHGAIARFFPETADRTLVEPSTSLASRAALSSPGANVLEHRFEDLHAVNKFDAIVMNPPFGHAGSTAIEHIKKAANHLRDGGRIVALIPRGATDEKLAKFMESPEAKGLYQVADINLPASTFERAGTKVNTRIVVLEMQRTEAGRDALRPSVQRDYSGAGSIAELFDRIEHSTLPERVRTEVAPPTIPEGEKTYQEKMADRAAARAQAEQAPEAPRRFIPAETTHGKTGEPLYVATAAERMDGDEYKAVLALAKQHGGYYSAFRGKGAIPGFQFKSAEERAAFLAEASNDTAPKFQVERRDTPPDLFAGIEPLTPRAEKGPFAEPAPDPGREHFDQNHADLYRLAKHVGTPEQRKAEAQRLATEMGQFMDWSEDEDARLAPDGTPRPVDMMRAAREYADAFKDTGKASFYDAEAYHDVMQRWYEHQGGERPKFQRGDGPPREFKPQQGHVGFAGKGAHLVADLYGVPADATGPHAEAIRAFAAAVEKVAPHVRVKAFERLSDAGYAGADKSVVGATYRRGPLHVIAWSLETPDAMHTAHHEAIHALRNAGLFTAEEWRTLESAAVDQDWMGKYGINDRWGELPWDQELEEAIAERFANWQKGDGLDLSTPIGAAFQKIKDVLAALGQAVRRLFGQGVTADDVLRRISAGEVGRRAPGSGEKPAPVKFQRDGEAPSLADVHALARRLGVELETEERGDDDIMLQWIKRAPRTRGAGAEVMNALIAHADATGKTITLGITDNKGARKLQDYYENLGFERDDPNDDYDRIMTRFPAEGDAKFQRKGIEPADEEPKGPAKFITRVLGRGVDTVGKKLARAAERVIPDPILSLADETKMALSPMGSGSARAQAAAKDFANELRASAFQWDKVDKWLGSRFSLEQQKKMWEAADEEGVLIRRGVTPGQDEGLNRLTADERAATTELQRRADAAFSAARELGMVNSEGLESYVPRMVVQMTAGGPRILARSAPRQAARGGNLSTTTGQLRQRKYETVEETEAAAQRAFGEKATVVRNIRTLALATQRLERAIAGRVLVDKIKAMSKDAGADLVVEGGQPDSHDYFTLDHPALQRWGPKFITLDGKVVAAKDQNGDVTFQATPVWISREFEGPLKAVLSQPTSGIVRALGDLKGKMMSVIMYSPLMHNAVIWGKAIPADPRGVLSLEAYRRGFAAKQDRATMEEAMRAGLDPIGRRFFNQDVTAIAEGQQIVPGRSWTSQVLAYVPGLFDPKAGEAVKLAVDKLGDMWHNTFLWDRVADLQMGLYVHIRDQLTRQGNTTGIGAKDAQRIAAHFANRYAGALPQEGMSKLSREMANLFLFSRSFTLGNLGAYKDIIKGMPSDVRSQVLMDGGIGALERVQGTARRKALSMMVMDVALSYAGLFLAAAATAWLTHQKFQPPWENEEDRQKRFLIGYQPDGTAIYGRLPTGKVGEELQDWATEPREILLRKLSPYGRLIYATAANDKGFGRKLYLEGDPLYKNAGRVGWYAMQGVAPVGQLQGMSDAFTGAQDKKTAALQALAPIAGVTISKGAPGGPAMSDFYKAKDAHDFAVQEAMPDIRRQIHAGDVAGARAKMTQLGIAPGLQNYYVRVALAPGGRLKGRALADFNRYATPEQKARLERDRAAAAARDVTP